VTATLTAAQLDELQRYLTAYEYSSNLDPEQIAAMWSDSEANQPDVLRVSTLRALLELGRAQHAAVATIANLLPSAGDPEYVHGCADSALLDASMDIVSETYGVLQNACAWWATA